MTSENQSKQKENNKDEDTLMQMIMGKVKTQLIFVAAKLKIADLLKEGGKSVEELAETTSTHSQTLYRILRALASLGVFAERDARTFEMTQVAERLRSDHPNSVRPLADFFGSEWHNRAWSHLLNNVQTGKCAFETVFKTSVFNYLENNPEEGEVFNYAMSSFSKQKSINIAESYDFTNFKSLVDVGGGHGTLLKTILNANPSLQGVLFDMPSVVEGAVSLLDEEWLTRRSKIIGGNFFNSVPRGADAYILKNVIHNWNDEMAGKILQNCREAMAPGGKVLLAEAVIPDGNNPSPVKLMDIEMMLIPGGIERTEGEYQILLAKAGLKLNRIVPTSVDISIVECVLGE